MYIVDKCLTYRTGQDTANKNTHTKKREKRHSNTSNENKVNFRC